MACGLWPKLEKERSLFDLSLPAKLLTKVTSGAQTLPFRPRGRVVQEEQLVGHGAREG